jgi:hypothetical protein
MKHEESHVLACQLRHRIIMNAPVEWFNLR